MSIPHRTTAALLLTLGWAFAWIAGTADPAAADRCEVTELVVRAVDPSYEEPLSEAQKPYCAVIASTFPYCIEYYVLTPNQQCVDPRNS